MQPTHRTERPTKNLVSGMPALVEIARGRDFIPTRDFAFIIDKKPQTIRKRHCLTGEAYGLRPRKIGNDLLWPVVGIAALLAGGAANE